MLSSSSTFNYAVGHTHLTNDKRFSKDYNKALMYRAEMLKNVLKGCKSKKSQKEILIHY